MTEDQQSTEGDGTQVFSVRFFNEVIAELDSVVRGRGRSRNYLIQEAVCEALGMQLQLIAQMRKDKRDKGVNCQSRRGDSR